MNGLPWNLFSARSLVSWLSHRNQEVHIADTGNALTFVDRPGEDTAGTVPLGWAPLLTQLPACVHVLYCALRVSGREVSHHSHSSLDVKEKI